MAHGPRLKASLFDDRWRRLERRVALAIWLVAAALLAATGLWAFFLAG